MGEININLNLFKFINLLINNNLFSIFLINKKENEIRMQKMNDRIDIIIIIVIIKYELIQLIKQIDIHFILNPNMGGNPLIEIKLNNKKILFNLKLLII